MTPERLTEEEQLALEQQCCRVLARLAPRDWQEIHFEVCAVHGTVAHGLEAVLTDSTVVPGLMPEEVLALLGELRERMYQPGRGTWFAVVGHLATPNQARFRYELDEEPRWDSEEPTAADYAADLARFPRDPAATPEWLRRKVDGTGGPGEPPAAPDTPGAPELLASGNAPALPAAPSSRSTSAPPEVAASRDVSVPGKAVPAGEAAPAAGGATVAIPETGPLNEPQQRALLGRIAGELRKLAPPGWHRLRAIAQVVGYHTEFGLDAVDEAGAARPLEMPRPVALALLRMRSGMYEPGRGTWFRARLRITADGGVSVGFDHEEEPRWGRPPTVRDVAEELRLFPLPEHRLPAWLAGLRRPDSAAGVQNALPERAGRFDPPAEPSAVRQSAAGGAESTGQFDPVAERPATQDIAPAGGTDAAERFQPAAERSAAHESTRAHRADPDGRFDPRTDRPAMPEPAPTGGSQPVGRFEAAAGLPALQERSQTGGSQATGQFDSVAEHSLEQQPTPASGAGDRDQLHPAERPDISRGPAADSADGRSGTAAVTPSFTPAFPESGSELTTPFERLTEKTPADPGIRMPAESTSAAPSAGQPSTPEVFTDPAHAGGSGSRDAADESISATEPDERPTHRAAAFSEDLARESPASDPERLSSRHAELFDPPTPRFPSGTGATGTSDRPCDPDAAHDDHPELPSSDARGVSSAVPGDPETSLSLSAERPGGRETASVPHAGSFPGQPGETSPAAADENSAGRHAWPPVDRAPDSLGITGSGEVADAPPSGSPGPSSSVPEGEQAFTSPVGFTEPGADSTPNEVPAPDRAVSSAERNSRRQGDLEVEPSLENSEVPPEKHRFIPETDPLPGRRSGPSHGAKEPDSPVEREETLLRSEPIFPPGVPAEPPVAGARPRRRRAASDPADERPPASGVPRAPAGTGGRRRARNTEPTTAEEVWPVLPLPGEPPLALYRDKRIATLPPDTEVDRFGTATGNVVYAAATPYRERSLPGHWARRRYRVYRLRQFVEVVTGTAVPWLGQPGGGTAYVLPKPVGELLAEGVLVEIDAATTRPPAPR
ncbi:hypothetical protein GCM10012275_32780 [Longimycelium tulufanense]|uniref:TNT domain-containing protein n=1 Tax=Longimycelium tulufanense TaxID=907463 RepID=A0A8J3FVL8_9PSEU|nr:glycohydrolase toxin TNT-related protein [Longimycelium tulufanense]GGM59088.1 hypothetical protein GCM10012275_32780 [Longimycelium tulufanense]